MTLGWLTLNVAVQAGEIKRSEFDAAMAECQSERQRNIEPLRQQEIERCVDGRRGDREYCERFNRDFGELIQTPNGMMPGLFWDLPICERAYAAERHFRMNPRSNSYSYEGT
jgi:hypothetical protein